MKYQNWEDIFGHATHSGIGTEQTMTARDVTGSDAFFSAQISGNFLHIFGVISSLRKKNLEKKVLKVDWRKRSPVETAPGNCRFLSLVVVERVLMQIIREFEFYVL